MTRVGMLPILALLAVSAGIVGCGDDDVATVNSGSPSSSPDPAGGSPTESPIPTSPTTTPALTTTPLLSGWLDYLDPVLGFSVAYPPDLVFEDLSVPSTEAGLVERVLDFRSPSDRSRGLSISVSSNRSGLAVRDWALEYTACLPETIEDTSFNGSPAIRCTEQATETPNAGFLVSRMGRIYHVGGILSEAEFDSVLASLELSAVPPDWLTYTDPHLGFSIQYPPGVTYTDSGLPDPSRAYQERDVIFASDSDPKAGFAIAIVDDGAGLSLEQWAFELGACLHETMTEITVDGSEGIYCTGQASQIPSLETIFRLGDTTFKISSLMEPGEFEYAVESFRFES